ncbi:MAG: hypothetical protein ACR2PR_08910 [Pseudohongiellaceae bacterium]
MALLDSPFTLNSVQTDLVANHNASVTTIAAGSPFPRDTNLMQLFPRDMAVIQGARKILADNLMAEVQTLIDSQATAVQAATAAALAASDGGRISTPSPADLQRVLESGQDTRLKVAETRREQLENASSTTLPFGLNVLQVTFT